MDALFFIMTKKELLHRKRAYEIYQDNPDFFKINGITKFFDIEKAVAAYESSLKEKRIKREEKKGQIETKRKYHYNVDNLFKKGYGVIDYESLEDEWKHRNGIALRYEKEGHYSALFIKLWLNKYIEKNNITIAKKKIVYNDRHYAIRNDKLLENDGLIYDINDYIKYTNDGIIKYGRHTGDNTEENKTRLGSDYKSIGDLIKIYYKLFYQIGITDKDLMFVHIIYLLLLTVDLDSWIYETENDKEGHNYFSPMTLKNNIERYEYSNTKACEFKGGKSHRFQKLFLEPGFEKEGRENYQKDKRIVMSNKIYAAINKLKLRGQTINNISVYNETIRIYDIPYRKFMELVKEFGIEIGEKLKFQKTVKTETKTVTDWSGKEHTNTYETVTFEKKDRKQHKQHKQQERSKWHGMVDEGKTYDEIIEIYPEVSRGSYRKYKSRLNKK